MRKERPAILEGPSALISPLFPYPSMGREEKKAVEEVMSSGRLSGFYGSVGEHYLGGPWVRKLEEEWAKKFGAKYAVSLNSGTSGLHAAMGAIGLKPGDEVIVPSTTMSATAMAPLVYGGIPIFVDIEEDYFCLDPNQVEAAITDRSKAILTVNLFGHPSALFRLKEIAKAHNLKLIEDNAQAPLASEQGAYAGTIGDIGVFSLNCHKHIQAGEGGVCVTNDEELAQRLQRIRNHGENAVKGKQAGLVGFNLRMTELTAAVALAQLRKIDEHVARRVRVALKLTAATEGMNGLTAPKVRADCRHVFYVWAARYDAKRMGLSRENFSKALLAEGFPNFTAYVKPLYFLPIFQEANEGDEGWPKANTKGRYAPGRCPAAERMYENEILGFEVCAYDLDDEKIEALAHGIRKVYEFRKEIAEALE